MYIYIYIYIEREREREREGAHRPDGVSSWKSTERGREGEMEGGGEGERERWREGEMERGAGHTGQMACPPGSRWAQTPSRSVETFYQNVTPIVRATPA